MYANNILAVSGALIAAAAAVPMAGEMHHHQHHQREIVWETATDEVVVTVPITKTIWIEPGETHPTEPHPYSAASSTPEAQPAAYTPSSAAAPAPAYTPETSSSAYVAPPAYTPPASSSSVYVAPPAYTPTTSTSIYVAPTPESTYVAPTSYVAPSPSSTYVAPAPSSSAASYGGSSSGGLSYGMAKAGTSYSGDLTYFTPGLGACGHTSGEGDDMVAISETIFDSYDNGNPNANPLCGQVVNIKGNDGSTYPATIWDRCTGCAEADLDMPETFFNTVTKHTANGAPADGRAHGMEWSFA